MKKLVFPLEKVVLFLFYLESMTILEAQHKKYFWMVVGVVSIVSYIYEGARPYTPIFFLVAAADYFDLQIFQTILVVLLGALAVLLKFYHIQIVGKGPYNAGYKYLKKEQYEISIFYPSMADGEHAKWIPSENYSSTLYDIAYVNPAEARLPFRLFNFIISFLFKLKMPVLGDASLYVNDHDPKETWNLIVFSHGLGSNLNNYSSLCGWFASHGYIVVSIQHNNDLIRIEFPKKLMEKKQDHIVLQKLFYKSRNHDLQIRAKEMETVLTDILQNDLLNQIFKQNKQIKLNKVYLTGHSFGGATALETMANLVRKDSVSPLIKGIICMDAWFFPLSQSTYDHLKDQNILLIHSETFFSVVPYFYFMEEKLKRLRDTNKETMKAFTISKTDHLCVSDFVFTFGNLFKLTKTVKLQEQGKGILELHEIIISLFIQGESKQHILDVVNEHSKKMGLSKKGISVQEECRFVCTRTS